MGEDHRDKAEEIKPVSRVRRLGYSCLCHGHTFHRHTFAVSCPVSSTTLFHVGKSYLNCNSA